jgi:anaerobic magnesium-protoporphyrin IX monomethyl ester cyclase
MKVLLVEPSTGKKGITTFHYPPLGLLALASYIRQHGYEVSFWDGNLEKSSFIMKLGEVMPDVVGISCMSLTITEGLSLAQLVKIQTNAKVVLGGIHPTIDPKSCESKYVDKIIQGEGEQKLLDYLEGREVNNNINLLNLDDLPIPAYDLINLKNYYSPYASRFPFATMVRSRGCVFHCTFCGNGKMYGNTFRCQSPKRTIDEVEYLYKTYHIKELSFKDTELTLDKHLIDLCEWFVAKNLNTIIWSCNGRASNLNPTLLRMMRLAGCRTITYGVESGNNEILKHLKKPLNKDQVRKAVEMTKSYNMQVVLNFMIGNPYDTKETIEQTIDFAIELDPDYAYFGYTTPFPGTELREQAIKNGWLLDDRLESIRYDKPIMNATNLPIEELNTYLDIAYKRFYMRPKYIFKQLKSFRLGKVKSQWEGLCKILRTGLKKNS